MNDATTRGRVLIIDDDELVGKMLMAHARSAGFAAQLTTSPQEFYAIEREWKPTFVIVDLVMGEVDGLEVLKNLAQVRSGAAVVIASGMGAKILEAAQQFAAASGLAYGGVLHKPFRRAEVVAVLDAGAHTPDAREMSPDLLAAWDDAQFESALRAAAVQGDLAVVLQPKVSCSTRRSWGTRLSSGGSTPNLA